MSEENSNNICLELNENLSNALKKLIKSNNISSYKMKTMPVSGVGENSYGCVLQHQVFSNNNSNTKPLCVITKSAPTNDARRQHMKVAECYKREVFMYQKVFIEFDQLYSMNHLLKNNQTFNCVPKIFDLSLKGNEEFLIFEDLSQTGHIQFSRKNKLTFHLTALALKTLAKFHAMSFVLQTLRSDIFENIIQEIRGKDNLFTQHIEEISIEFGKKYIKKTIEMIQNDENIENKNRILETITRIHNNFKEIGIAAVNGQAPYSVICHGDFWNNNILFQYDDDNSIAISAKMVDFQMSRYASPVLDIFHYLFCCTEKDMRDMHFEELMDIYYTTLSNEMKLFNVNPSIAYPHLQFQNDIKMFGVFGFCMAAFSIPFFISDSCDIPDLDEVSEAIQDMSDNSTISENATENLTENSTENATENHMNNTNSSCTANDNNNTAQLLGQYELLTERTLPIFKQRMVGCALDLVKYNMTGYAGAKIF